MLRVKNTMKPSQGLPMPATQREKAQDKRTDAGCGYHPQGNPHEKAAEIAGYDFAAAWVRPLGKAQLPDTEETGGENDQDGRHRDQDGRVLQHGAHEAAGQARRSRRGPSW